MPDLECRLANVEERQMRIEIEMAQVNGKINLLTASVDDTKERRRKSDEILEKILLELSSIREDISKKNGFNQGVAKTIWGVTKIVTLMSAFISAIGAGAWALVNLIFNFYTRNGPSPTLKESFSYAFEMIFNYLTNTWP